MPEPTHSPPGPASAAVCASCGAPADDTAPVRRVYVTPGACDLGAEAPEPDTVQVLDEVEAWCFPCRSQYPHQPLEG